MAESNEDKLKKALKKEALKRVPPKKDDGKALDKIRKRTQDTEDDDS